MKRNCIALGIFLWMGISVLAGQGVHFETGPFEAAQAKAKKEGKMVMLVVCADWMEVCTIMEGDIFTEPEIGAAFNPYFVSWRLDADQIKESPFFAGVRILSIPEFIFFDADGSPQYREKSLHDHDEMLAMAASARNRQNHLSQKQKAYAAGNRGAGFVQRYIIEMDAAGHDMAVAGKDYLSRLPKAEWVTTDNWIILTIGIQDVAAKELQYVLDHKHEFVEQFGEENVGAFFLTAYENSLGVAIQNQNPSLLARCKQVIGQITDASSARMADLQADLAYHSAGNNWPAYETVARDFMAGYDGDDAVLYNDVAWTLAEHGKDPGLLKTAEAWARKSIQLQAETWNWHTLASLQLRNGDLDGAQSSAEASLGLAKPGSDEAGEAKKLLERIENSR